VLAMLALVESKSSHPVAKAIADYVGNDTIKYQLGNTEEIALQEKEFQQHIKIMYTK
jgi:cation transport ATPase